MGNPNRRDDSRRQAPNNMYGDDDPATRTTFYVTNFSDRITGLKLKEAFKDFVTVTDAWVPKRRTIKGRVFGFVRCLKIKDPHSILHSLNKIVIMNSRIVVSLAMFDRSHRKISYDVVDMGMKAWVPKEKTIVDAEFPPLTTVFGGTSGAKKTLELNDEGAIYPMHCMGRAVIGVSNTIARLHVVKKMLVNAGYKDAAVSYLGGLSVLITFHDSTEMTDFMVSKKDVWEQALISVSPWTGQSLPFERIVVLKVVGMPVSVRENVIFDRVGTLFGKVVWPSDFSWSGNDNSVGFTHVLTRIAARIDEEVTVQWKGNGYNVWVVEAGSTWIPEFEAVNVEDRDDEMEEGEIRDVSPGTDEATSAGNIPVNNSPLNTAENQGENSALNREENQGCLGTHIPAQHSNCVGQNDIGPGGVGQEHGLLSNEFVGNNGMGFNMGRLNSVKSRKRPRLVFNNSPEDNNSGPLFYNSFFQDNSLRCPDLNTRLSDESVEVTLAQNDQDTGETIPEQPEFVPPITHVEVPGSLDPISNAVVEEAVGINKEVHATVQVGELVGLDLKKICSTIAEEIISENEVLDCQ